MRPSFSRRRFGQAALGSALGLGLLGNACSAKPLPPGKFTFRKIENPLGIQRYSAEYSAPLHRFKTLNFTHDERARRCHYYIPTSRPVQSILLLLHGSNRNGASLIDSWTEQAEAHGIALIAPDSFAAQNWSFEADGFAFFQTVIERAREINSIADVPIYGFGHSAGAIMMTHLSIRHGDYFTAASAHAGHPQSESLIPYGSYRKARSPMVHILGSKDHIFDIPSAEKAGRTLASQGQNFTLIVINTHNHWYYDLAPFINKTSWAAMREAV